MTDANSALPPRQFIHRTGEKPPMKTVLCTLLCIACLMGLSACAPAPAEGPEPENSSSTALPLPGEDPEAAGSIEAEPHFYEQVVMTFGAEEDPDTGDLRPLAGLSLLYDTTGWASPAELSTADAYAWFWGYVSGMPEEEAREKYASPSGEGGGWFYPQEEFEATLMQYFEVTPEQLRSDPSVYLAKYRGYQRPAGPGLGERPALILGAARSEGQDRIIPVSWLNADGTESRMELTIRIAGDGRSYRFQSWLPVSSLPA